MIIINNELEYFEISKFDVEENNFNPISKLLKVIKKKKNFYY